MNDQLIKSVEKLIPRRIIYLEPESTGKSLEERQKKMHKDMGFNECVDKIIPIVSSLELDEGKMRKKFDDTYGTHGDKVHAPVGSNSNYTYNAFFQFAKHSADLLKVKGEKE